MILQTTFGFDSCVMGKSVMVIVRLVLGYNHEQLNLSPNYYINLRTVAIFLWSIVSNLLVLQHTHYQNPQKIVSHLKLKLS